MKALYFTPGKANSTHLDDIELPPWDGLSLRIRMLAVGVCGTDRELVAGDYGWPPPGQSRLVIGHESIGRVEQAPQGSAFMAGDLVAGIVRHPDPVPCPNCAIGEWDMCRNGKYTEHGIKERDGFCREMFDLDPEYAVRVDQRLGDRGVLLEPASVVAKAWEHIENIGRRALFEPRIAVITGAGPVGLLAALMGVQRGLEIHVVDRVASGPKVDAVNALGAYYHCGTQSLQDWRNRIDIVVECTGADRLVLEMIELAGPNSVVCLTGVSSGGRSLRIDLGMLNRSLVLENAAVFGSVNANRRHYDQAARSLHDAAPGWLDRLLTRRVPLTDWPRAFERREGDIKTIIVPDPVAQA